MKVKSRKIEERRKWGVARKMEDKSRLWKTKVEETEKRKVC